jgi:hypothetical protein
MSPVHVRASRANSPDQAAASAPRNAVHWDDPADIALWIVALRGEIDDALAAGEDATRLKGDRVLSRAEARRKLLAAEAQIETLLDAGERSLERSAPARGAT